MIDTRHRTPFEQLAIFFLIWFACFLLTYLATAGLLKFFYDEAAYEVIATTGFDSDHPALSRLLQALLPVGIFWLPPLIFAFYALGKPSATGVESSATKGNSFATSGKRSATSANPSGIGGESSATGGKSSATGVNSSATDGEPSATSGNPFARGGESTATGEEPSATGGESFSTTANPSGWAFLKLKTPPFSLAILSALIIMLAHPLVIWTLELNKAMDLPASLQGLENYLRRMEDKNQAVLETLLVMNTLWHFLLNLLLIAIIPAIGEELLFRGTLQQLLAKWVGNAHVAIFITGFFFSFIHFQFYGFVPRMLLGVLLGYLFYLGGNLWLPMLAHFLNNGVQVLLVYLFQAGKISLDIEEAGTFPVTFTLISTALLIAAIYIFDLVSKRKQLQTVTDGKGLG